MRKTRLSFTVVNDLVFDQRMIKVCTSLANAGYDVTLIGRRKKNSPPLAGRPFRQLRFWLPFERGKLFYLTYNLRLLFHLLFAKYDVYGATDLDTIVPNFMAAKLRNKPFTYDAHEYFPELPEIIDRPFVKRAWTLVERFVVPRTRFAYTINDSYKEIFERKYGVEFGVVRNAARLQPLPEAAGEKHFAEKYILYQGAVNVGRGVEEMIEAMPFIDGDCKLYVCGKGDVFDDCVALAGRLGLQHRVVFWGRVPPEKLREFTLNAYMGFTFFTRKGISYELSLCNRFFDYFHAGVPQLCVDFVEYRRLNDKYGMALVVSDLKPQTIAAAANRLLHDGGLYRQLKSNCLKARQSINWQNEAKTLLAIYSEIKPPQTT